jgi:hypothetical protein
MPGPLGAGLAQSSDDIKKLYMLWQQHAIAAQTEGKEFPQFEQWLMMQGIKLPAMPARQPQAQPGISLRGISDMAPMAPAAGQPSY